MSHWRTPLYTHRSAPSQPRRGWLSLDRRRSCARLWSTGDQSRGVFGSVRASLWAIVPATHYLHSHTVHVSHYSSRGRNSIVRTDDKRMITVPGCVALSISTYSGLPILRCMIKALLRPSRSAVLG